MGGWASDGSWQTDEADRRAMGKGIGNTGALVGVHMGREGAIWKPLLGCGHCCCVVGQTNTGEGKHRAMGAEHGIGKTQEYISGRGASQKALVGEAECRAWDMAALPYGCYLVPYMRRATQERGARRSQTVQRWRLY